MLLVHARLRGHWSGSRKARGSLSQIRHWLKTGNETEVNLSAPRNTPLLWPSVLTGLRRGFLFFCLLARRHLRWLFLFLQGIMHETRPIFTAQFYPDANPGPRDAEVLYENWSGLAFRWRKECRYVSATVASLYVADGPKSCFWKCWDPNRGPSYASACVCLAWSTANYNQQQGIYWLLCALDQWFHSYDVYALSPGGIICVLEVTEVLKPLQDWAQISCTWGDCKRKRILS